MNLLVSFIYLSTYSILPLKDFTMPKKHPYTCPRCEYFTSRKSNITAHLYDLKKPCPAIKHNIELTEEIKQSILFIHTEL